VEERVYSYTIKQEMELVSSDKGKTSKTCMEGILMPSCPECEVELTEVDIDVYECHNPSCSLYLVWRGRIDD
jgi:hypothetical protein